MNPYAGMRQANRYLAGILDLFCGAGYDINVAMTQKSGDGTRLAKERAEKNDIIVAIGGDGTFNEVVSGVIESGYKVPIGYIPAGSTNDFAHSVGLPKNILDCADTAVRGTAAAVDIGSFNGRYFSYVASFGAFTSVTYSVPQNLKNIFGHAAYVMGGITEIANLKAIHARITADPGTPDERRHEGDYLLGAVCNSKSVGGILRLDKLDVDMNDGQMEVLLVKMPKDILELNDIAISMLGGTFKSGQIESFSAGNLDIEIEEGTHWTLDGEYEEGSGLCKIHTLRSAISLIKR
jgi:YegS/Rv2252/BmrU family lipid kinase